MKTAIVYGGRKYKNKKLVYETLDEYKPDIVLTGDATGADRFARQWTKERGVLCLVRMIHDTTWERHGKQAGPQGNRALAASALGLARQGCARGFEFPGGKGTADMHGRLAWAEIKITVVG